jgi:threonine dehydratase
MAMSLQQGRRITLSRVDAFADGVAVKHVSSASMNFIIKHLHGSC